MSSSCDKSPLGLSPSAHLADGTGDLILVWDTNPLGFLTYLYRHTTTQDQVCFPYIKINLIRYQKMYEIIISTFSPSLICRLWRSIVWRRFVSPWQKKPMTVQIWVVRRMEKMAHMSKMNAELDLSSTWQWELTDKWWQVRTKQWPPSCVVFAAENLPLCQSGTVMEKFCLSLRSTASKWAITMCVLVLHVRFLIDSLQLSHQKEPT